MGTAKSSNDALLLQQLLLLIHKLFLLLLPSRLNWILLQKYHAELWMPLLYSSRSYKQFRKGLWRTAKLEERCDFDMECISKQMVCRNHRCVCMEGQVPSETDRCIARVNSQCYQAEDCLSLPRSDCVDHKCICRKGSTPSSDGAQCLEDSMGLNGPCQEAAQCLPALGLYGYCSNMGICVCMPSHHYSPKDMQCIKSAYLNGQCANDTQCVDSDEKLGILRCDGNKLCRCGDGYIEKEGKCIAGASVISISAAGLLLCLLAKHLVT